MAATLSIFGDIERFAADLYDFRYPITAALVVAALVTGVLAYRAGAHRLLWRHRLAAAVGGTPLLIVAILAGNYFLSPLWERSFLEESSPIAEAAAPSTGSTQVPSTGSGQSPSTGSGQSFAARTTHRGEFEGADSFHFGRGQASLIETAPGKYVLRFENFSVRNGPDLFVYLSPNPDGYDSKAVNLGGLKATDGSFNYDVSADVDVSQVRSVVIWCRQFTVLFAHAELRAGN